ncbi:MAG TPA: nickel-responsive transcriptional regulator NikR, partial [Armatimonadota bacterium]|nr:nickel-responsive transcriptional regulator NikR [Armatimonadota bacterium]
MSTLERFGVSMEDDLLQQFDALIERRRYSSRSEAIRDLVRQELVNEEWTDPAVEVVGTVTIVYEHHEHELANVLTDMQHQYHQSITCATHIHLDAHNCLEVIVLRGQSRTVRDIADALISTRGVKHGQLVCTTTGKD